MTVCIAMDQGAGAFEYLSSAQEALQVLGHDVRAFSFCFRGSGKTGSARGSLSVDRITLDSEKQWDCGRSVVEALARFQETEGYSKFVGIAQKTLDRHDYYGVLRNIDRVPLIKSSLLRVFSYLLEHDPQIVVFLNTPHLFGDYLTYEVANHLGIKTLHFQPTPLCPAMLVRSQIGLLAKPVLPVGSFPEVHAEINATLDTRSQQLLDWESPPYIKGQIVGDMDAQSLSGRLRGWLQSAKWLTNPRFEDSPEVAFESLRPEGAVNILKLLLSVNLEKSLRRVIIGLDSSVPLRGRYAIFALHYEPERTVTPEGLPFVYQEDAIIMARQLLPDEVTLVIKEHYSQGTTSLRGYLGRSPSFYRIIRNLPNTVISGTSKLPKAVIEQAQAIFTMTGTIGVEAANLGVPVGFFGNPWWEGLPGTIRVEPATQFEQLQRLQLVGKDSARVFFRDLVGQCMIPGIASENLQSYQRRNVSLSEALLENSAASIIAQILSALPTTAEQR